MLASASAKKMKGDIPVFKDVNLTSFLLLHVDNSCMNIIATFEIYTRVHTYPYLMFCNFALIIRSTQWKKMAVN